MELVSLGNEQKYGHRIPSIRNGPKAYLASEFSAAIFETLLLQHIVRYGIQYS